MASKNKIDPYKIDEDNPEWTKQDFAKARKGSEVFAELGIKAPRGRPRISNPKKSVTLRLDNEVIELFKGDSPKGWQSRVNQALRKAVGLK